MKRIKEKLKRTVKYWRITYQQASERDRVLVAAFTLTVLTYLWWALLSL